jgi:hypothetical protein
MNNGWFDRLHVLPVHGSIYAVHHLRVARRAVQAVLLCGKTGYATSYRLFHQGKQQISKQRLSQDDALDDNGDKVCRSSRALSLQCTRSNREGMVRNLEFWR